jgi:O-antigen ligase
MRGEGEKSFFTRWDMIQEALKLWMQSPLWGNGNEAYRVYGSYGTYSHTNYTELLANYGLLGLCFFYGPIVAASWQSWKMRSSQNKQIRRQSLWLLICCLILFPISLVNVIYYTKYMLLFYAVVLGRVYYLKDNYQRLSSFGGEGPYSPRHSQHGYR